jgi:hypothetical protein
MIHTNDHTMDSTDKVVEMLTRLICGVSHSRAKFEVHHGSVQGHTHRERSVEYMYDFPEMFAGRAHTFDATDPDRVYAADPNLLLSPVAEILGDSAEVAVVFEGAVRWMGFRRTARLPRGVCTVGKAKTLYEAHSRTIDANGGEVYTKSMLGLSPSGKAVPVIIPGVGCSGGHFQMLTLAASVIEDSRRPETVSAEFTDGATLVIPVDLEDYQDLFALRDAPLSPSGRRKAILHWVAKHRRRHRSGPIQIPAHQRGVHQFVVDGLTVRLTPNARLGA